MPDNKFDNLLNCLDEIAIAVNAFKSDAVQQQAFAALLASSKGKCGADIGNSGAQTVSPFTPTTSEFHPVMDVGSAGTGPGLQLAPGQFWQQQGPKLVDAGAGPTARQGASVALSADGNIALVGGQGDYPGEGAAWVYTRSGGVWTRPAPKLVGTGAVGSASQGSSVALSADGNTAIVGGPLDNGNAGAAWVYTRSGGIWTQQGTKLVGTGAVGSASQGRSVALSADGNTAIVGGYSDGRVIGAAWVYTRSGGVWTQQGTKLVGTGALSAQQGASVALSADGNTAVMGGERDNGDAGAVFAFTRSDGEWAQQGTRLVAKDFVGPAHQGISLALSADGNTAIVGGQGDNWGAGAAWIYVRQ